MAILVGFHVEGWDHLIFHVLLSKLLDLPEADIQPDWIDVPGRGWAFVIDMLPKALKRFYGQCSQAVVVGIDNDGNCDLTTLGGVKTRFAPVIGFMRPMRTQSVVGAN